LNRWQHIPFFAISPEFAKSLWSSYYQRLMKFDGFANIIVRFQHLLFYTVMSLARFNLYANSYLFLAKRWNDGSRTRGGKWVWWAELLALAFFWTWYSRAITGCGHYRTRLAYFLISNIVPSPLHVQVSQNLFR
jgi:delta8-fatty-acid desaturase